MDFLNDQVNHLQKEDASPKTEDIDLEEDAENKKEVINNCEAVDEKEFIYQVVPFSQDSKARFRRNIQSFYVKPESVKFMIFDNQLAYCKLV